MNKFEKEKRYKENNEKIDMKENNKAFGTFGFGGVQTTFPLTSDKNNRHYFYKDDGEDFFRLCQCGNAEVNDTNIHTDSKCELWDNKYKVFWRKYN